MPVTIRKMQPNDRAAWVEMRSLLWGGATEEAHFAEMDALMQDDRQSAYMAITPDGQPLGFAEVSLRDFANGAQGRPVPFLEGIWVSPDHRRQGVGRQLLDRITADIRSQGYREICSDADIDNLGSLRAHAGWGFQETERVVYFRRELD